MAAISGLTEYQLQPVKQYLALNEELRDTYPKSFHRCTVENDMFIIKGFQHVKQRYQCKCCGSKFTYDVGRLGGTNRREHYGGRAALPVCLQGRAAGL